MTPADDRRYPKRPLVGVGALIFNRGRIVEELRRPELSVARLTALVGGATHMAEAG